MKTIYSHSACTNIRYIHNHQPFTIYEPSMNITYNQLFTINHNHQPLTTTINHLLTIQKPIQHLSIIYSNHHLLPLYHLLIIHQPFTNHLWPIQKPAHQRGLCGIPGAFRGWAWDLSRSHSVNLEEATLNFLVI